MRDRHDRRDRRGHDRVSHRRASGVLGRNLPRQQRFWRQSPQWTHPSRTDRAETVLTEAAQAAGRTKNTYLGARYHAIRGRRGTFKAVGAIRHDILIAYWHIVSTDTNAEDAQVGYRELGADWITSRHSREYQIAKLARQMEKLGATVTVTLPTI